MIGHEELMDAVTGHGERTGVESPDELSAMLDAMGVEPVELANCIAAMVDQRGVEDDGLYGTGILEGVIVGVRAARREAETWLKREAAERRVNRSTPRNYRERVMR